MHLLGFKVGSDCTLPASLQTSHQGALVCVAVPKAMPLWRRRRSCSFLVSHSSCHPLLFLSIFFFCSFSPKHMIFPDNYYFLALIFTFLLNIITLLHSFSHLRVQLLIVYSFFYTSKLPLLIWTGLV